MKYAVFAALIAASTLGGCAHSYAVRSELSLVAPLQTAAVDVPSETIRIAATADKPYQRGKASWYEMGVRTASGEKFNPQGLSAAHPNLPFGTRLRVVRNDNAKLRVDVTVNDRGPFVAGRIIDVSAGAADVLEMKDDGVVSVSIYLLNGDKVVAQLE